MLFPANPISYMILRKFESVTGNQAGIYLFKVNNRNSERFEICSKLTIKERLEEEIATITF